MTFPSLYLLFIYNFSYSTMLYFIIYCILLLFMLLHVYFMYSHSLCDVWDFTNLPTSRNKEINYYYLLMSSVDCGQVEWNEGKNWLPIYCILIQLLSFLKKFLIHFLKVGRAFPQLWAARQCTIPAFNIDTVVSAQIFFLERKEVIK